MYLNSAKVTSWVLNGKDYTGSRKRFMKALCETHNFTVNLVLGNKLLGRGNVSFMENNGWVIAHVDSRFAFDKDEHISGLIISICNNGNEILSSETDVSYFINGTMSTDADLYFIVGSVYAYNESKSVLPESFFRSSNYDKLTKINYEDLPSPVGPEPFDGLRIISDEFLVTKDGINTETAYSVLEIPNEAVQYLSQDDELANFGVMFMGSEADPTSWTGVFSINDHYMMLYMTGDMPDPGEGYGELSLTTVHPFVYESKEDPSNPTKVSIPGDTVTIKTYVNGAENNDRSYRPYLTSEDNYQLMVLAYKEGEVPAPVILRSVLYEVSNDYEYDYGYTFNTKKNAYTEIEIKKPYYDMIISSLGNELTYRLWVNTYYPGGANRYSLGFNIVKDDNAVMNAQLSQKGWNASDEGGDYTLMPLKTVLYTGYDGDFTKVCDISIKTYIEDGTLIETNDYVPCDISYNEHEVTKIT